MKFDYIIGNPPYQDETLGDNETFAPPVYNKFMDASYKISDNVCLITPARFLFNAGSTPKAWNERMLRDPHFKVVMHEQDSAKIFPNTDIKGGVAVHIRDKNRNFGAIEVFTSFPELNAIYHKVTENNSFKTISTIVYSRTMQRITNTLHEDFPNAKNILTQGHMNDMASNIFDLLPEVFLDEKPADGKDYIQILGRQNNLRVYKWCRRDYVNTTINLDKYKVFVAGANGCGAIGETLSTPIIGTPIIGTPIIGNTESFISIGAFETLVEAENCFKYVRTKFARTLLGILKVTQAITPEKWKYVPIQDFTLGGDIDWSKPIHELDAQLYKKYNLSATEIAFIEEKVRAMV